MLPRWSRLDDHFTSHLHNSHHIRNIAGFRLGSSWLNAECKRKEEPRRSRRHYHMCSLNEIEDELHILMCSAYCDLRSRFPNIFQHPIYMELRSLYENGNMSLELDHVMKQFMNIPHKDFWSNLAHYLICTRSLRSQAN